MKRSLLNRSILAPGAVLLCILGVWELGVWLWQLPLYILPAPTDIGRALLEEGGVLLRHAGVTLQETAIGLILATLLAVLTAILMDRYLLFRTAIYPLLVVSQTIPVIVLAPIFMIYLGFGLAPKILVVVLMCFFPVVISFADGMAQVDGGQVNLVRLFGAGEWRVYTLVKIPAAAPSLFSGLKVSATYSITGAVVGEWLASQSGLGYYMLRAKNGFLLDRVFACVLVIAILSLGMNGIVRLLEYLWLPPANRGEP